MARACYLWGSEREGREMARKAKVPTIEYDSPATIDETIEGLQELRLEQGGDAIVHVLGWMEINAHGSRVRKLTALPASAADPKKATK